MFQYKINIKTEFFDNFKIQIPNLEDINLLNNTIVKNNCIIVKIVSFNELLVKNLITIIKAKYSENYDIYFDLRECVGGIFNNMLKTLEIFSTDINPIYIYLENGEKNKKI